MLGLVPKLTSDTQATSHLPMYARHSYLKIQTQTLPVLMESFNFMGLSPRRI